MKFLPLYPNAAAGPTCHLFSPISEFVAVGKINVGPAASSQLPTNLGLGDSASASTVSPNPLSRLVCVWSGNSVLLKISSTGRVIRLQSSLSLTDSKG